MKIALFESEDYPGSPTIHECTEFLSKPDCGYIRLSNIVEVEFEMLDIDRSKIIDKKVEFLKKQIDELERKR